MADPHTPPEELIAMLNDVVDAAIVSHSSMDETFHECRVCGEWEGHKDGCPIPAIEQWLVGEPPEKPECEHAWRLNKAGRICVLCLKVENVSTQLCLVGAGYCSHPGCKRKKGVK